VSKCYDCRKEIPPHRFRCDLCYKKKLFRNAPKGKRRVPLNEWEEMKLGFYRDEKKWLDNIGRREIRYKGGKQYVVLTDGKGKVQREMPKPRPLPPKLLKVTYNPQKIK